MTNAERNYTMLCDFYELTMGNGYFQSEYKDRITIFDVFFRNVPDKGGFAIAAGLEQVIDYIENLHFSDEDIAYLRGRGIFDEAFLAYLRDFRFTGDIYAVPEGTPIFPKEPIMTVRAPAIQAQLIETGWSGQQKAGPFWNSAPAAPRAWTAPYSAQERPISAAVPVPPAP